MSINMYCRICNQAPMFKCKCDGEPYLCPAHLPDHINSGGNHLIEYMDLILEPQRLRDFKSNILNRINRINVAKNEVMLASKSLLAEIKELSDKAINKLDFLIKSMMGFLKTEKFFRSDLQKIEDIESKFAVYKLINVDDVKSRLNKCYGGELITFMDDLSRIDHFLTHYCNGALHCGAVTCDLATLVTGGYDGKVRGWDLAQKKQTFVLHGHLSRITCLALIRDSIHAITGSFDASVRIWNIQEKSQVAILKGHQSHVTDLCYIEERSLIITGGIDKYLIIWDFIKHSIFNKLFIDNFVTSTFLMKNQSTLILGSFNDIYFYELETKMRIKTLKGHSNIVRSLLTTSDEKFLISGSYDKTVAIWDLNTSQKIFNLVGHTDGVNSLTLTLDEQFIISGARDIRVWNFSTGEQVNQFEGNGEEIFSILRTKDKYLTLSGDSGIGQLDIKNNTFEENHFMKYCEKVFSFFSAIKRSFIFYKDGVVIWDIDRETEKDFFVKEQHDITFMIISDDYRFAIIQIKNSDGVLFYWDIEKNQKIGELKGHTLSIRTANISSDNCNAISYSYDKTIIVWDLIKYELKIQLEDIKAFAKGIKLSNCKKYCITIEGDYNIVIRDLDSRTIYAEFKDSSIGNLSYEGLYLTCDYNLIATCDEFKGVQVWNIAEKRKEFEFGFIDEAITWLKKNKLNTYNVRKYLKA